MGLVLADRVQLSEVRPMLGGVHRQRALCRLRLLRFGRDDELGLACRSGSATTVRGLRRLVRVVELRLRFRSAAGDVEIVRLGRALDVTELVRVLDAAAAGRWIAPWLARCDQVCKRLRDERGLVPGFPLLHHTGVVREHRHKRWLRNAGGRLWDFHHRVVA